MEHSTPQELKFVEFCKEILESHKPGTGASNDEPSNIIKNQSFSTDHHPATEGQICYNMRNLELVGNRYSDFQTAPSTTIHAAGTSKGQLIQTNYFLGNSSATVIDDPMLHEEVRKGSLHWDEEKILYYARKLFDEDIQLLQSSIDSCQDQLHFCSLVRQFLSNESCFVTAAFHKKGSICIQKMIKKIKKTDYAFIMTKILALHFYEMMTHPTARIVVQKCLDVFESGPNLVLYKQAINYFLELATHEVGCFSLKACIDTIGGEHRTRLLDLITHFSCLLSIDPHGNYIVQHVLGLRISTVNRKILSRLQGQFVWMSQTKEGSHVTEKCLECCDLGPMAVVHEILHTPDAAYLLARHPFGNYVIQKALVMTKITIGCMNLYKSLVEALRPHCKQLNYTVGRHVVNRIKDEF